MNQQDYPERWHSRSFHAMGCEMAVWLELENEKTADSLLQEAEAMFHCFERRFSRFDPTSELSRLNSRAGSSTAVSEMMWAVVTQALYMARETDGLFDPTQLIALEAAGYTHSYEQMVTVNDLLDAETTVGQFGQWQLMKLDVEEQSIWLPYGVKLDLGGIAKGFTAQKVVDYLSDWGPCLVDASGDLTAGYAPSSQPGWPVAVSAPYNRAEEKTVDLFPLWLVEGSMATSGIDYRRWQHNGRSAHHVIDPHTGLPAETDLLTATVLAKTAVRAEAWATAALIDGKAAAQQRLTDHNLAAAFVDQQGGLSLTPALAPFLTAAM